MRRIIANSLRASYWTRLRRPAVNDNHLAGHERSFIRSQVQGRIADFLRLADAPDRLTGFNAGPVLLVLPEILTEVGLDEAWSDGVDADIVRPKLTRPAPRHHDQARLGEAVEQAARLRL